MTIIIQVVTVSTILSNKSLPGFGIQGTPRVPVCIQDSLPTQLGRMVAWRRAAAYKIDMRRPAQYDVLTLQLNAAAPLRTECPLINESNGCLISC